MQMHLSTDAVVSKYQDAAGIAIKYDDAALAAASTASIAYYHMKRGADQEAWVAAKEALALDIRNALAQYIQLELLQNSGEVRSLKTVQRFEKQLAYLAGSLGAWPDLEASRAALHKVFFEWRAVDEKTAKATGGTVFRQCLQQADVAKVLICTIGRLLFP